MGLSLTEIRKTKARAGFGGQVDGEFGFGQVESVNHFREERSWQVNIQVCDSRGEVWLGLNIWQSSACRQYLKLWDWMRSCTGVSAERRVEDQGLIPGAFQH